MVKTILNRHNIMLKQMLVASCTLMFLLEASSTSNLRETEVATIGEVFAKIFRRKRSSRSIPYYHNSTSALRIILSGDIELNPGLENPKKYPIGKPQRKPSQAATCETCNKTIRTNTKRLSCICCNNKTHLLCSSSYNIKITNSRTSAIWMCSKSCFRELPFASPRDIEDANKNTDLPISATFYINIYVERLKEYLKHLSTARLNT